MQLLLISIPSYQVSSSTISKKFSIGLNSGDGGDRRSTVSSSSRSPNHVDMIWAVEHICYPSGSSHQQTVQRGHRGTDDSNSMLLLLNHVQLILRGLCSCWVAPGVIFCCFTPSLYGQRPPVCLGCSRFFNKIAVVCHLKEVWQQS